MVYSVSIHRCLLSNISVRGLPRPQIPGARPCMMVLASLSSLGSRDIEIKIFTLIFGLNLHFITVNHQKL